MRNINFLVVLLSLVLQSYCKEKVKFGIANGTVFDTTEAISTCASNLAECITKCQKDEECILADYKNETCYLHPFGHNILVNMTTAEEGRVAFKLRTDQKACGTNLPNLLKNNSYYLYANHTEEFVYRIETHDNYYLVIAVKVLFYDGQCKPYFLEGEYQGGTENDYGFVEIQGNYAYVPAGYRWLLGDFHTGTFEECREKCRKENTCQSFIMNGIHGCIMSMYNEAMIFQTDITGKQWRIALKLPFNNVTCKMTPSQLFNNRNYQISLKAPQPQDKNTPPNNNPKFFTIRQSSTSIAMTYFSDDTAQCPDRFYYQDGTCVMMILYHGHPANQSHYSNACKAFGASLVSAWYPNADWTNKLSNAFQGSNRTSWTSIKLKPECYNSSEGACAGDLKWTSEDMKFAVPSMIAPAWAQGQPKIDGLAPEKVCAVRYYKQLTGSVAIMNCDVQMMHFDGVLSCVREPNNVVQVPTIAQVKAEWDGMK